MACVPLASATVAVAATLRVTTTTDEPASPAGQCSLREAVATIDAPGIRTDCGTASRRSNTIVLKAGHYTLSVAPTGADDNTSGDLNVTATGPVLITGAGTKATVIDASALGDRVLSIASGAKVTLRRVTVTGGHPPAASPGTPGWLAWAAPLAAQGAAATTSGALARVVASTTAAGWF